MIFLMPLINILYRSAILPYMNVNMWNRICNTDMKYMTNIDMNIMTLNNVKNIKIYFNIVRLSKWNI
jgi:hypothetical protein